MVFKRNYERVWEKTNATIMHRRREENLTQTTDCKKDSWKRDWTKRMDWREGGDNFSWGKTFSIISPRSSSSRVHKRSCRHAFLLWSRKSLRVYHRESRLNGSITREKLDLQDVLSLRISSIVSGNFSSFIFEMTPGQQKEYRYIAHFTVYLREELRDQEDTQNNHQNLRDYFGLNQSEERRPSALH